MSKMMWALPLDKTSKWGSVHTSKSGLGNSGKKKKKKKSESTTSIFGLANLCLSLHKNIFQTFTSPHDWAMKGNADIYWQECIILSFFLWQIDAIVSDVPTDL